MVAQHFECTKRHRIVYFKMANFMVRGISLKTKIRWMSASRVNWGGGAEGRGEERGSRCGHPGEKGQQRGAGQGWWGACCCTCLRSTHRAHLTGHWSGDGDLGEKEMARGGSQHSLGKRVSL